MSKNQIYSTNISNDLLYLESTINLAENSFMGFSSKKGYFYIQISDNEKITKRKIEVTLESTEIKSEQTVMFNEAEVQGYADNHNFQIITPTTKTKLTNDYYTILTMEFSFTKPAHNLAQVNYLDKVNGYRFNFREYTLDNSGTNTINNTGHNLTDTTEKMSLQINLANCGINQTTNHYVASNATGHIKLNKKYYSSLVIDPNEGNHNGNMSTYIYGNNICGTKVKVENPVRQGYQFTGWTFSKGHSSSDVKFDNLSNEFTYCGKSISDSDIEQSDIHILKANWAPIEIQLPEAGGVSKDILFIVIGLILISIIILNKKRRKK